jgi:anaerobic C4-dicarboxylate transporter
MMRIQKMKTLTVILLTLMVCCSIVLASKTETPAVSPQDVNYAETINDNISKSFQQTQNDIDDIEKTASQAKLCLSTFLVCVLGIGIYTAFRLYQHRRNSVKAVLGKSINP